MKRATISETKNRLSALLELVRRGEEVLILDRETPIAKLVPVERLGKGDDEARLAELERRGVLRRPRVRPDARLTARLGPPPRATGDVVAALISERDEGR